MANYTSAPEDEYDVLIEDNLTNNEIEPCTSYDPKILLAQLVPHLYTTLFMVGLLDNILAVLILVKYKGLKYVENIYFLNLAIANLCFVLTLPFWAYTASHGGVLGNPLCKTLVVFYSIGLYSEAFFNALLTVQTYFCYMRMRKTPRFREARHDIFKLVFTIMVVFLLMWGPYNIALFLSAFNEHFSLHDCNSSYNLDKSVQITKIIATIHCCVNPLLYVFLDNAFREHLRRHLCCLCDDTAPQPTEEYAQDTSRGEHHLSTNM
ncbi:hypothetical protein CB1_008058009 [Camelus ferus]|nr:hypothetical protein CB1_008058009 [Camelus ferus]